MCGRLPLHLLITLALALLKVQSQVTGGDPSSITSALTETQTAPTETSKPAEGSSPDPVSTPTLDVNLSDSGSQPVATTNQVFDQSKGTRHVNTVSNERIDSTTIHIPDVTATSQRIILLKNTTNETPLNPNEASIPVSAPTLERNVDTSLAWIATRSNEETTLTSNPTSDSSHILAASSSTIFSSNPSPSSSSSPSPSTSSSPSPSSSSSPSPSSSASPSPSSSPSPSPSSSASQSPSPSPSSSPSSSASPSPSPSPTLENEKAVGHLPTSSSATENVTSDYTYTSTTAIVPKPVTLILTFNSSCDDADKTDSAITSQLAKLTDISLNNIKLSACELTVQLEVTNENETLEKRIEKIINKSILMIGNEKFTLIRVKLVNLSDAASGYIPKMSAGVPFSSREIITYATVGAVFCLAIIVIVCSLLCCKCCCARNRKDEKDIPNWTMRLEDYSLTRIPRPNTLFNDVRQVGFDNGVDSRHSQSFDTSVVPIDDSSGYAVRKDLHSFNSKKYRQRIAQLDEDMYSRGSSVLAGSTERLAREYENSRIRQGHENPTVRY